jgi:hypothetical protein
VVEEADRHEVIGCNAKLGLYRVTLIATHRSAYILVLAPADAQMWARWQRTPCTAADRCAGPGARQRHHNYTAEMYTGRWTGWPLMIAPSRSVTYTTSLSGSTSSFSTCEHRHHRAWSPFETRPPRPQQAWSAQTPATR